MTQSMERIIHQVGEVVFGKTPEIRMALACLLARGHLLIEDLPGIGKTTLGKVLARTLGLEFKRIQCTNDMLPGDILGVSVYEQATGKFTYHPGPVFTQVLLTDEINRATPKTQSALLEAMEEKQVTMEGVSRPLPRPFFVIATQNPLEQFGTFPLPESQLDRFLMRISIGYPDRAAEQRLLRTGDTGKMAAGLSPIVSPAGVMDLQKEVESVHFSDSLLEYVQDIIVFTRQSPAFSAGLSPRAGLALVRAAKAWAKIQGRDFGLPEDVQAVLVPVAGHRLRSAKDDREYAPAELKKLFQSVPIS